MRHSSPEPSAKDTEAVHPKNAPTASEIMNRHVHTVEPTMGLYDVTKFLLKHEISNAPVVRREANQQVLLGFISEADCLEFLANGVFYGEPSLPQTAETMMKRHPVCVGPEQDVFTLTSIFMSHNYRHLPVVDGHNLLGIVSRRDVIRALDEYYRQWTSMQDRDRFPVDLHQIVNQRFLVTR